MSVQVGLSGARGHHLLKSAGNVHEVNSMHGLRATSRLASGLVACPIDVNVHNDSPGRFLVHEGCARKCRTLFHRNPFQPNSPPTQGFATAC